MVAQDRFCGDGCAVPSLQVSGFGVACESLDVVADCVDGFEESNGNPAGGWLNIQFIAVRSISRESGSKWSPAVIGLLL